MGIVSRISACASEKGMSIAKIESELEFGQNTIYKWDRSIPSAEKLWRVANLLNTSMDYLMTGETTYSTLKEDDREWLELIHSLPKETQRDFKGAMRLHKDLHDIAPQEDPKEKELLQAK